MTDSQCAWLELSMTTGRAHAERLSDALSACGAAAVSLADAGDEPLLEPAPGAAPLWSSVRVVALVEATTDLDALRGALRAALAPEPCPDWSAQPLVEQDWVQRGRDRFGPTRFGERLWVVPGWCEPPAGAEVVVRLDPGLAFGTGSHQTTALCLRWLDRERLVDTTVVDYGCGSGVLSIAALGLGAARALAVDIDPQAVLATRENAQRNGQAARIEVSASLAAGAVAADVLVANILAGPLVELAPHLLSLVRAGGRIALSGLLAGQAEGVRDAYAHRVAWEDETIADGWALLSGTVA